jgi:glycosyltransferase involved in cell wall biosynthesis
LTSSRTLRVLQVLRAPTGGLWRHVVDLSKELSLRGHDVGLVLDSEFSDRQTNEGLETLAPYLKLGVHRIAIGRQPSHKDISAALKLRRLASELQINVIHGHGAKGGLFARLGRLGTQNRIAVYTPHGGVLNYPQSSLSGKLFRKIERWLLPITDVISFESAFARHAFTKQVGRPSCLSPVVHNGLKPAEFGALPPEDNAFDFVFIGELRTVKGIPFLLDALTKVVRQNGQPANLLLVGGGPDKARLETQITRLGLKDRVYMAGIQPAHEMFSKARCVVVPSLAESLPYIILEAVAAEKQVLATRVGGIHEIFGPTQESLLPPSDASALAKAMQQFIDFPDQAQEEAKERLEFVRDRFSLARMTTDIETNYLAALAKRS